MHIKTDTSPSECQKPKNSNFFWIFPEYSSKYLEQVSDFSNDRLWDSKAAVHWKEESGREGGERKNKGVAVALQKFY